MRKLISTQHFRAVSPAGIVICDAEREHELELAIGSASDLIENYMGRKFLAAKHKMTIDLQDESRLHYYSEDVRRNKIMIRAPQFPVHKVLMVFDSIKEQPTEGIDVKPFGSGDDDPESWRKFAMARKDFRDMLTIEYAAGYRLHDETDDQVNKRLGTESIVWPEIPALLSQTVVDIVNGPARNLDNVMDSLAAYRRLS